MLAGMLLSDIWCSVMTKKRQVLGIVAAPIAAPIVFTVALSAQYFIAEGWSDFFDTLILIMVFGVPIAYLVAIFFGLPLFKLFQKLGWINFWSVTVGGGVVAVFPLLLLYISNADIFPFSIKDAKAFGLLFFCGLVVGAVFWLIAFSKSSSSRGAH